MKKLFCSTIILISIFSLAFGGEKIVIKGSDTLGAKLVPQLAEQFKADNPGVTFEIAAEGSSTGIAAVIDSTADIGMSSREAKDKETSKAKVSGVNMMPIVVGFDGIAVIVNERNPINKLSKRDVERVFTGDVANWSAVRGRPGNISVYTRNTSSGTYSAFKSLAMKKRDYGTSSQKMAGNEQIASEVAKNPFGIGYVGLAYIDVPGIKVIAIEGIKPSQETVVAGTYPYARPLYYYTNGVPTRPIIEKFINFTLSPEGQKIVSDVHFVPVN